MDQNILNDKTKQNRGKNGKKNPLLKVNDVANLH